MSYATLNAMEASSGGFLRINDVLVFSKALVRQAWRALYGEAPLIPLSVAVTSVERSFADVL